MPIDGRLQYGSRIIDLHAPAGFHFRRSCARQPGAPAVPYADINALDCEIYQFEVGIQAHIGFGAERLEVFDSWQQPFGRKGGTYGNGQYAGCIAGSARHRGLC